MPVVNPAADGFDGQRLLPSQQLYSGSVGLFIASLSGDTAQQVFTFQDGVSIGPQSHGVVLAAGEGQLTNPGSTQIGFNASMLRKLDKQGSHSLEAIERSNDYLATGSDNGLQTIVYDIWDLGRHQGEVVVRLAKARGRFNQGNIDYLPDADATSTASVNFTWAGEVLLIGTAGTRGQDGVGGIYLVEAVPTTSAGWANYVDGDIIIAKPQGEPQRGVWVKESTTTHGSASTGLGGLTLDPSTDLAQIAVGRFTHQRFARNAYTNPRGTGNIAAGGSWGSAPSGLSYLDFDYSTNTRADGEVHLKYASPQTYTGDVEIRAGSAVVHLGNIDSTTWRVTGLQAPVVEQLRSNDWTFTEVGVTTTTIVHDGLEVANLGAMPVVQPVTQVLAQSDATAQTARRANSVLDLWTVPQNGAGTYLFISQILMEVQAPQYGDCSLSIRRGASEIVIMEMDYNVPAGRSNTRAHPFGWATVEVGDVVFVKANFLDSTGSIQIQGDNRTWSTWLSRRKVA